MRLVQATAPLFILAVMLAFQADLLANEELAGTQTSDAEAVSKEESRPSLEELKAIAAEQSRFRNASGQPQATESPKPDLDSYHQRIRPILQRACFGCHGEHVQEASLRVDALDPNLGKGDGIDWWLEVLAVLTNEEMPPPDEVSLSDKDRVAIIEWLSGEVQLASTLRRASGEHTSFRRLTRYEYNYALQDLLGAKWQFARDLPPDPRSEEGFQNSSELLHLSVTQLETYRRLARKALARVTVQGEQPPKLYWGVPMGKAAQREWKKQASELEAARKEFKEDPAKLEEKLQQLKDGFRKVPANTYFRDPENNRHARATWRYSRAAYAFEPTDQRPEVPEVSDQVAVIPGSGQTLVVELGNQVPDEGILRVRVRASRVSEDQPMPSLQLMFGWQASNEGRALLRVGEHDHLIEAEPGEPQFYQWDVPLGDIYPRNSVRKTAEMGGLPSPSEYIRLKNSSATAAPIQIDYVEVATPVYDQWPPQTHRRIFFASENANDESVYAGEILERFMTRAWRRELRPDEVERKLTLFHQMRAECDSFEEAMVEVLATVLSSPNFLYVVQRVEESHPRLDDHDLATRLAMFLWCSVPDDRLRQLAESGRLSDSTVLDEQVDRMLADPRAERFSRHFVHQWLNMELLEFLDFQHHNRRFDPLLKEGMQQEPVVFFHEVLKRNDSVLDFIHADYAMVNERLARHYGWSHVHGNHFRRVRLKDGVRRGGMLTQAGLLAMNSDGEDSHPLKRGVWLLERVLNDPPPPPPPAVPEIDLADPEIAKMTLKERIEDHRNHAACRSCHAKIDPWGIAFENYDALGRWRNEIQGKPVDATSVLFNNQPLEGMEGLKRFLIENRQDQFVRSMVDKLAGYALGRPPAFADHAELERIAREVRQQGDGLATLIRCLVTSDLFQTR